MEKLGPIKNIDFSNNVSVECIKRYIEKRKSAGIIYLSHRDLNPNDFSFPGRVISCNGGDFEFARRDSELGGEYVEKFSYSGVRRIQIPK